ncbi:hypothetical protein GMES_3577 [Paraglaciecola mesophila KMM 241]|uniref:Uncharacterized protein n=1 Tax=Paraglaciecola mesophila KMM 241 TaxID=1128912 RepID=K6XZ44_9ALTE|nr:hypothetical protein [Paraglaciecola mesophila]GAC25854.1 hypothetical protein GMES_3577 [Paraglaciecola mesophila KMM 241]|tara:strand:- start:520 stop:1260 length:741 start_codon:yes stop_codon:yes gene_type:complete
MSSAVNQMGWGEKISLGVSILSFLVAFIGLTLSDSVSKISSKADIVATNDTIKLNSLINQNGYIETLNLKNRGRSASKNVKLIVEFFVEIPKFELTSDEDIGKPEIKGRRLKIPLERLSSNSNLKITMFSDSPISYDINYIDDSGNHKITMYRETAQRDMLDMILILVIIISLLAVVWIYRRASESALMATLETHQSEIQVKLREVRDEIGNIEVVVNEPNSSSTAELNESDKGIGQRLADFITKI